MASFMKEFEHLRIQFEEIKKATNNFGDKVIGSGGFGAVYKGEVLLSKGRSIVAIKRLNRQFGQGDPEFLKEIMMLSRYRHQNLISLLGFCDEENEKVLVYEYAPKGSLDRHLSDPGLTWTQRIKICLGAAKGLSYLHDPRGTHQRVLHCDIKCANILLDENMTAKVTDFGLSKMGPANQDHSILVTNSLGTYGYCDPEFMKTYTLTKESDVYSFGVVLFEVLCGRLCYQRSNGQVVFVPMWKKKFVEKKLNEIILQHLMPQMHPTSLDLFTNIAFQCLHHSREGRPKMSIVVEKLEKALENQELYDRELEHSDQELPEGYREMLMTAITPLEFKSVADLKVLFSNGVFLIEGKKLKSCSRAMKAVGIVEATCEEIFELVMSMDGRRYEWDCSFQYGSLIEKVDGHTDILYHSLLLHWFPQFVWPRDLCYERHWRQNDDGSYVVRFSSREHEKCALQTGYVRAHMESGRFNISPLKPSYGRPRSQVQYLMQIDLKGWGVGYVSSFQQHCLLRMLNSVAGLREYFAQTDIGNANRRVPVMVNMPWFSVPTKKTHLASVDKRIQSLNNAMKMMDEYSDEDEDFQILEEEAYINQPQTKHVDKADKSVLEAQSEPKEWVPRKGKSKDI